MNRFLFTFCYKLILAFACCWRLYFSIGIGPIYMLSINYIAAKGRAVNCILKGITHFFL